MLKGGKNVFKIQIRQHQILIGPGRVKFDRYFGLKEMFWEQLKSLLSSILSSGLR